MNQSLKTLRIGTRTIAVRAREGKSNNKSDNKSPGVFWLGGFKSDMQGTKAVALDNWAASQGRACVRFDYSGHGESGGDFAEGTIGGWIALLLARALKKEKNAPPIAAMVLIAPAVDFTEELMWKQFPDAIKRDIEEKGAWMRPSEYSNEPYPITRKLIEDGRKHLMLGGLIETGCPVHILQGVRDPDVPWRHAEALVARLARDDVVLTLVKDGDHRLSRPEDLERLIAAVAEFN
jgi:hypothetical protein